MIYSIQEHGLLVVNSYMKALKLSLNMLHAWMGASARGGEGVENV